MTFASATVPRHLLRGAVGLGAFIGAFVAMAMAGGIGLLLLPVAAVAWRGCPTCWTVGLLQTREREAERMACACSASTQSSHLPDAA